MTWGALLQPDLVLGGPILQLTLERLQHYGLKGLVLDVDDTLVPFQAIDPSDALQAWVASLRPHLKLWLVSNNLSATRIGRIGEALDVPYSLGATKPSRRKLRQAVQAMGLPVEQVAMVGDRLFTDVLAGNRLGMFTILVEPMVDSGEALRRSPMRSFEVWLSQRLGVSLNLEAGSFSGLGSPD